MPTFEFDPVKSAANRAKHGIDFVEAQALWLDPDRIEVPARSISEARVAVIGRIGRKVWFCVVTHRPPQTIRLISCRHARPEERRRYDQR